jgi:hypothetical protein
MDQSMRYLIRNRKVIKHYHHLRCDTLVVLNRLTPAERDYFDRFVERWARLKEARYHGDTSGS